MPRQPARWARHREVEDLLLACRLDRGDAIPVKIRLAPAAWSGHSMVVTGSGIDRATASRSPVRSSSIRRHPSGLSRRCAAVARIMRPLARVTLKTGLTPFDHTRSERAVVRRCAASTEKTSGVASTRSRIGSRRPSPRLTSVSPVTHSRRSDITGRLFGRCSSERLSCDSATTGTLSSFASDFIAREISEISVARFSPCVVACISCR